MEVRPPAYVVAGVEGEVQGNRDKFVKTVEDAEEELSRTDPTNTFYRPPPYNPVHTDASGTAQEIYEMVEENQDDPNAVVFYMGHAGTNVLLVNWPSGGTDLVYGGNLINGQPAPNNPGYPGQYYLANLSAGALQRTALIVFGGCVTLGEEPDGDSLWSAALAKGADVAAGFSGQPTAYPLFFDVFWTTLNRDGETLWNAFNAALQAVLDAYDDDPHDCDTFDIRAAEGSAGWCLCLRPGRYGE